MKPTPDQPEPHIFTQLAAEFPEATPEQISRAMLDVIGEDIAKFARKEIRMKAQRSRN